MLVFSGIKSIQLRQGPNLHSNANAEGAEVSKCRRRISDQFSFGPSAGPQQVLDALRYAMR